MLYFPLKVYVPSLWLHLWWMLLGCTFLLTSYNNCPVFKFDQICWFQDFFLIWCIFSLNSSLCTEQVRPNITAPTTPCSHHKWQNCRKQNDIRKVDSKSDPANSSTTFWKLFILQPHQLDASTAAGHSLSPPYGENSPLHYDANISALFAFSCFIFVFNSCWISVP